MPRVERIAVTCVTCGKVVYLLPCHAKGRKFCSTGCRDRRPIQDAATRFWPRVLKTDGCWIWQGYKDPNGYGQIGRRAKLILVHRLSWELTYGSIPNGLWVLHSCDNPSCVRPDHLFLGTNADNVRDMVAKGRARNAGTMRLCCGDKNVNAKLTGEIVREVRQLCASGVTRTELARRYGVNITTISRAVSGRTWGCI